MFHQGELRLLAGAVALFLAGTGWRVANASSRLPPLAVEGRALEWTSESLEAEVPSATLETRAAPTPAPSKASRKPVGPIDVNHATVAELESLSGIGPALARRIVEARSNSPFQSLADLDRVKGIGPAKLEKLRTQLTF